MNHLKQLAPGDGGSTVQNVGHDVKSLGKISAKKISAKKISAKKISAKKILVRIIDVTPD
jgi:hypothetical protein